MIRRRKHTIVEMPPHPRKYTGEVYPGLGCFARRGAQNDMADVAAFGLGVEFRMSNMVSKPAYSYM